MTTRNDIEKKAGPASTTEQRAVVAEFFDREIEQTTETAHASIRAARAELDVIEAQLNRAAADEPYLRIGMIRGVDAGAVFRAFGAIENGASTMARMA